MNIILVEIYGGEALRKFVLRKLNSLRETDPINQWLEEGGLTRNVSKKYGSLLRDLYIGFCEVWVQGLRGLKLSYLHCTFP